ncbi:MAG: quercetin 2,3-dioxygenase, partial [Candidatus Thiodiazotropha sp. (ex Myrtea spinifera)]|nr:quercetin 2,3-dioxygenase [Candidatus Thiodiazotropha sp. (ex Myrtea spinifera)]
VVDLATPVTYLDITLPAGRSFSESLPDGYNTFVYLIEGEVTIDDGTLTAQSLAELGEGEAVEITAASSSRLLLVAGEPLNEPIARRGPFVMNNEAELTQAFEDYQAGRF